MNEIIALKQADGSFLIGLELEASFDLTSYGDFEQLDLFMQQHANDYLFTLISYQLGYPLLELPFPNDKRDFSLLKVWTCKQVFIFQNKTVKAVKGTLDTSSLEIIKKLLGEPLDFSSNWKFNASLPKAAYLKAIRHIQQELQQGNIYELNFCQSFGANLEENPDFKAVFNRLYQNNPTPHAAYVEFPSWALAAASPERFIQKRGPILSSDPIKGTAKRGKTPEEDEKLKEALRSSQKERAENVMIVDLVRNDLSKIAEKGTVTVNELFGIYTYPTVHQLISSISCSLPENVPFSKIIRALFPMGSMTGAPKRAAVRIAGELENFNRELYSGSLGVVLPNGDFDFNVLIRTLILDKQSLKVNCAVGGAITILSDAQAEYEECKTKIEKIIALFGTCTWS